MKPNKWRCDVLYAKREESVKVTHHQSNMFSAWEKTHWQNGNPVTDTVIKIEKGQDSAFVFSYRWKAPMAICILSERSTLVATSNRSYSTSIMPAYSYRGGNFQLVFSQDCDKLFPSNFGNETRFARGKVAGICVVWKWSV